MKQRLTVFAALTSILLTFVIALPATALSAAVAEEGNAQGSQQPDTQPDAQSEGQDLLARIREQSPSAGVALTPQALRDNWVGREAGGANEANRIIKEETKAGSHIVIEMKNDWTDATIEIPDGADVTIQMKGWTINRKAGSGGNHCCAIKVGKNAKLTVEGGTKTWNKTFSLYQTGGGTITTTRNIAGLITGGNNTKGGGAIDMKAGSSVTLENVHVAGNRAERTKGSDGYGGGICSDGTNTNITLKNTKIMGNYANKDGGGIYANNALCTITLVKSDLDGNVAANGNGGGIHCDSTTSYINGDGSSSIRYNFAKKRGGGVFLNKSGCSITNVKLEWNRAEEGGGGAWADSDGISFSNLVVTNNTAWNKGGGLAATKKNTTISSCTITNNKIGGSYNGYVGAGVWLPKAEGISIAGTCVIKDNDRGAGNCTVERGGRVSVELARNSDVHMGVSSFPETYVRITPDKQMNSNCIRYLTGEPANSHFTYNANTRAIYLVTGGSGQNEDATTGSSARQPQATTTISPEQATPKVVAGLKQNGRDVIRGFVRFPNVENGKLDSATSFYYSDGYFLENATKYNEHLATASLCMAMSGFYLNEGGTTDYTNKHASARQFMSDIGCADSDIYVNDLNVQKPGGHTIGVTIASKQIPNTDYTLVPIAVRGAGYEAEWTSNVTLNGGVGAEHAGFADAATKVTSEVNSYLARHKLTDKVKQGKVKFWIAGYSRAGATSNLTARRLLDQYATGANGTKKCDVYAYPIEAPQGGSDDFDKGHHERYYSIHNVINKADLVPLVGPTNMGFKRYGVDHFIPGTPAGSVTPSATPVNRTGQNTNTMSPTYQNHEGRPLVADRLVYTWCDNTSYATNATHNYPPARAKMLPQLEAIDPSINFDDFFGTAEMDFFPNPSMSWKTPKVASTEEDFIRQFINDVVRWGVGNRLQYNNELQSPFQNVIGTVFSMDNESMAGFAARASTCMDRISTLALFGKSKLDVYKKVIGAWHSRDGESKKAYINAFMTAIDATGAYDYLTAEQKVKIKGSMPTFLDFAFRVVDGDYNNTSFGDTAKMMMIPTFALNASRIMSNHYPEVNLAWLRAADSFYDNDKGAYVIGKASTVAAPTVKIADKELKIGETNFVQGYWQTVQLDVKNLKGEAVYYKITKNGNVVSKNTCKNGYDIYRGPFSFEIDPFNKYTISAYAMSHGTKSAEVTYAFEGRRHHKITIVSKPSAPITSGETRYVADGTPVELKAEQRVIMDDTREYEFKKWCIYDEKDSNKESVLLPDGKNTNNTSFTMPHANSMGLTENYTLLAQAQYTEKVRTDNLHDIEIQLGSNITNQKKREGETVTHTPTLEDGKRLNGWQAFVYPGGNGQEIEVTNSLKPRNNGRWCGATSTGDLKFVVPRKGETASHAGGTHTFGPNDKLVFKARLVDEVRAIEFANLPDPQQVPQPGASDTYTYTCKKKDGTSFPEKSGKSKDVRWTRNFTTTRNPNKTKTTRDTYTAFVTCDAPAGGVYAKDANNVSITTNLADCTAKITGSDNGRPVVCLRVVKTETIGTPQYNVAISAYDINDTSKASVTQTSVSVTTDKEKVFEINSPIAVRGGINLWQYSVPDGSGLEAVDAAAHKFKVVDETKPLKLDLACLPKIEGIRVKAFPTPKQGEALATTGSGGIDLELIKPGSSVFTATYAPQIQGIAWNPASDDGNAKEQTEYTCAIALACVDNKQICFAEATYVYKPEGSDVKSAKFVRDETDKGKGTLYLTFKRTDRSTDHKVSVKSNADEGDPTTYSWKEREVKTITAKDDYDDMVFESWTVTVTNGSDTAPANGAQLQAMGLDANKLAQPKLALTMPAVSDNFANGYALSFTANYHNKAEALYVFDASTNTSIEPTSDATDLADAAKLEWHWIDGDENDHTGTVTTDITWATESAYSETTGTHTFTAVMHVDAQHARQLKRGEDLPDVLAYAGSDLYTKGTATWNGDGSLTVTVTFDSKVVPLPAYKVSIGAYDANSPESKLRAKNAEDVLVKRDDIEQVVVSETSGFTLAAPVVPGAEFVRWEIPSESATKIERVGGDASNKFKFADGVTAQDNVNVHALYKPVVKAVKLDVDAPVAPRPLATTATAQIELANADAFVNVAPDVAVSALAWTPNDNNAAYDTEYAAAATLAYTYKKAAEGQSEPQTTPWLCGYANDIVVTCANGAQAWFEPAASSARVIFPSTDRDIRHQVAVYDFVEDDETEQVKNETWYEGESQYLVAKQYDRKIFGGWTITRVAEGMENKDVTDVVLADGNQATNAAIRIVVPAVDDGDFPKGYKLVAKANYKDKADELNVTVPEPLGASGTVAWSYDGKPITKSGVPITWSVSYSEDASSGNKIVRAGHVATLHLQMAEGEDPNAYDFVEYPNITAQLAEGASQDAPQIDEDNASVERTANGYDIVVPFMSTEETVSARTVALQACDVNAEDHPSLNGVEVEESVVYADDEDGIMLWAPLVDGGVFAGWEYDTNVLEQTPVEGNSEAATFTFKEGAATGETYTVKALYKPIISAIRVGFAAPKAGDALATAGDATVAYEPVNKSFGNVGGTVSALEWMPSDTTAAFEESYKATLTCAPTAGAQYVVDNDTIAAYGRMAADLNISEDGAHKVLVEFDATEPRNNHKVTVVDNANGIPATYYWQETSIKHLVAQPNDNKVFSHWTITDQKGTDVTSSVLTSGQQAGSAAIQITMPEGVEGATSFPTKDYELSITASYVDKADRLSITGLSVPASGTPTTTSSWQWTDGKSTYYAPSVEATWTLAKKDDNTYVYTATMRLDANSAQRIKHDGLAITINNDANQPATATWDGQGNLTVTTSFTRTIEEITGVATRTVTIKAYDVNSGQPLTGDLAPILYNRTYVVPTINGKAKLAPYGVPGGIFCGFEVESGTAAQSVAGNELTFKDGNTGEAVVRALYKPIVSGVRVSVAQPVTGYPLVKTAVAGVTLANTAFFAPLVLVNQLTWQPADTTVVANKEYEAAVKLSYEKPELGPEWQYAYAADVSATTPDSAYITLDTDTNTVYLAFDENAPAQLLSIDTVEDLHTTYDNYNAADIKALLSQERHTVGIEVSGGGAHEATIEWEDPVLESDGGKLEGAVWRARGKLGLPNGVEAQDLYVYANVFVEPADTLDLVHVDQPADVYGLPAGADEAAVRAALETETDLILEEGVVRTGAITWTSVECVDSVGNFQYSAKWHATGTVALPSGVSNPDGVSLDVAMDVYVDLAPARQKAQMPFAVPEDQIFNSEQVIVLDTDEQNGKVYYRVLSGGDPDLYPTTEFEEYAGYPIYLERESVDEDGFLWIEAYTEAPNKDRSDTASFVYGLDNVVLIPEGEERVFDGTEQVGVWVVDGYELVGPSSGARIDEDGDAVATNAGTYTVKAKVDNGCEWYLDWPDDELEYRTTKDDQTVTFKIVPASVNDCDIELAKSAPYTGGAVTPRPRVTLGDYVAAEGRDYMLAYEDNVAVGKAKVTITGKGNLKDSVTLEFDIDGGDRLPVAYAGHVQTYGDQPEARDGAVMGTTGEAKRLEAFSARVEGGSIEYRSHLQKVGWEQGWSKDGELSGTTGQARRLEAVQMRLSARLAEAGYHVWYRVHSQTFGWQGWARDGAPAGTTGMGRRAEAVQVVVLRGDARPEGYDARRTAYRGLVEANAHVQRDGWLGYRSAGQVGTTGQARRLEALWVKSGSLPSASVQYQSHLQGVGWEGEWRADGAVSGTTGQARRVEAIRAQLTGDDAAYLSIWYRVHSQTFGWSGWAKDGQDAGSVGLAKRAEAVEFLALSRGADAPGPTADACRTR